MLCPPPIAPGDKIRIIAPSGPFDPEPVRQGIAWLSLRYRVVYDPSLFTQDGFLAGPDARRLSELNAALADPETRAVVAARGGYGLTRIAKHAEVAALRHSPKWVVGFSDITALHAEIWRLGLCSLHAHNVTALGRGSTALRAEWQRALESPAEPTAFEDLEVFRPGLACGPLVGGNLTVLFACAAAGRLKLPDGCVLFLEDVGEAPYRLDRALTALTDAGLFDRVAAVVVGDLTDCGPDRYGVSAEEVLRERTERLGVPVLAGLPGGHGERNVPLHFGYAATVDTARRALILEPSRCDQPRR